MEGSTVSTADSGSATTGPATFSDPSLSWSEASSASTPSPESTPAASTSADATVPPADSVSPDGSTPAAGEPPKERWSDILANARSKAAEDALAPYAWAKQVTPQEFQQVTEMAKRASADPIGYLQDFIKELQGSPEHAAQLRSLAAKALAQRSTAAVAEQEPTPDLPIQLEDGRVVHLYSAEQQAKREAFLQTKWLQSVEQKLQPLQQTHEAMQAKEQALAVEQQIKHDTARELSASSKWKSMDNPAFRAKVAQQLHNTRVEGSDPRDVSLAFREAYMAVRDMEDAGLTQKAETRLLDSLKQKAAAATSVNPGSAAASAPRAVTSFSDPSLKWK